MKKFFNNFFQKTFRSPIKNPPFIRRRVQKGVYINDISLYLNQNPRYLQNITVAAHSLVVGVDIKTNMYSCVSS